MKTKKLFFLLLLLYNISSLYAQTKHALLIGINEYKATASTPADFVKERGNQSLKWTNLDGCVNDIKAINQIITTRYGFNKNEIKVLLDKEATNKSIKTELENLQKRVKPGDIVLFYYSGHGSQVINSLSYDGTGKDQTIVPSDLYDIRNKELSKYFNAIVDKLGTKGKLTTFFDSCHSGAVARGSTSTSPPKSRDMPGINFDFKDPTEFPKIEERGALVFSAAQRDQLAKETTDEAGNPHGAFTYALIKALAVAPITESAERIFMRINIGLKSSNRSQDPVLGGTKERTKNGLFGENIQNQTGKVIVPVLNILDQDEITLQGGIELGITEGTVLHKINTADSLLIKIVSINGIGNATGKLVFGDIRKLSNGDFFEIKSLGVSNKFNLTVKIPSINSSFSEIENLLKPFKELVGLGYFSLVLDPIKEIPTCTILFENNQWKLNKTGSQKWEVLANLSSKILEKEIPKNSKVLIQIPASNELARKIKLGPETENSAIAITKDSKKADYTLLGMLKGTEIEYAWVKTEMMGSKENSITPAITDFFANSDLLASNITDYAVRLGKINAWANLPSPTQEDDAFPYRIALMNRMDSTILDVTNKVYENEKMALILKTDAKALENWNKTKRYCYVFVIDQKGKTSLLFPPEAEANERMPIRDAPFLLVENLKVRFSISKPFGLDTYYLLTSEVRIPDTSIFTSDGVVTRSASTKTNPLSSLLKNVGAKTRGIETEVPTNWSIQKLILNSLPK